MTFRATREVTIEKRHYSRGLGNKTRTRCGPETHRANMCSSGAPDSSPNSQHTADWTVAHPRRAGFDTDRHNHVAVAHKLAEPRPRVPTRNRRQPRSEGTQSAGLSFAERARDGERGATTTPVRFGLLERFARDQHTNALLNDRSSARTLLNSFF